MTCDQAFESMTDPVGASHPDLRRHLAHCARCRQMVLTLAPVLAWLRPLQALCEEPAECGPAGKRCATRFSTLKQEPSAHPGTAAGSRLARGAWKRAVVFTLLLLTGAGGGAYWQGTHSVPPAEGRSLGGQLTASLWKSSHFQEPNTTASPADGVMSCLMCHWPAGWR